MPAGTTPGTYPVTITGTGPLTAATHTVTYWLTVAAAGINNGNFETGDLSYWTVTAGTASTVTCAPHSGTYAAFLGGNNGDCGVTPTNGDSSISQTFTLPQPSTLSLWYDTSCPDTLTYDWATATLTDNTTHTTTVVLPKTCTTLTGWLQTSTALGASAVGHNFTLTLTSHDDNYPTDPTATKFDDITLTAATVPAAPTIGTATAGNSQATVSWTAPSSDGGSPIHGYVITAYVGYTPVKTRIFNSTLTTQTVTGLMNGTQYRFRVRAYNAIGVSGYSKVSNPVTPTA